MTMSQGSHKAVPSMRSVMLQHSCVVQAAHDDWHTTQIFQLGSNVHCT